MNAEGSLGQRPISMEYGSGRRHTVINGFYYCETELVAEVGSKGEEFARVRKEHFLKEHGSEWPEGGYWSRSAVVVASRNGGEPVFDTQLEKMTVGPIITLRKEGNHSGAGVGGGVTVCILERCICL